MPDVYMRSRQHCPASCVFVIVWVALHDCIMTPSGLVPDCCLHNVTAEARVLHML
jgi:hypothetical protein